MGKLYHASRGEWIYPIDKPSLDWLPLGQVYDNIWNFGITAQQALISNPIQVHWGGRWVNKPTEAVAGFTCLQCPYWRRNWSEIVTDDNGRQYEIWHNTERCKMCRDAKSKNERFSSWFDELWLMATKENATVYFASITIDTSEFRSDNPSALCEKSLDALSDLKKRATRMIRDNDIWKPYRTGLVVCENKWRRPGEPVYETGRLWVRTFNEPFGIFAFDKNAYRITEQYEAHPHLHLVGLNPGCISGSEEPGKMPWKEINELASSKGMNVHFEHIPMWRAKKYLSKYMHKGDPTRTDGRRIRAREKLGRMRK